MRKSIIPRMAGFTLVAATAGLALLTATAAMQAPPPAALVVNRMTGAYRSLQSYYAVATVKGKRGKKEVSGTLTLATQKPNKYLLDLKGDSLNTLIVSDGEILIALRPDRRAYTKTKAPPQIIKADFIGKVDMPSLGARLITQFLTANAREGEFGNLLVNAKVTISQSFGSKPAYVLTFPYGEGTEVRVYVTSDDYLIRQVMVVKEGNVEWLEKHDTVQPDKPAPAETFSRPLPEGALMVTVLPALDKPAEAVASESGSAPASGGTNTGVNVQAALAIYRTNRCGGCHENGRGPNLNRVGADPSHTAKWIADHIKNPRAHTQGSQMPAFAGRISEQDIQILAAYLASLK